MDSVLFACLLARMDIDKMDGGRNPRQLSLIISFFLVLKCEWLCEAGILEMWNGEYLQVEQCSAIESVSIPCASDSFDCERDIDLVPLGTFDVYAGTESSRSPVVLLETRWVVESGSCPTFTTSFPRRREEEIECAQGTTLLTSEKLFGPEFMQWSIKV